MIRNPLRDLLTPQEQRILLFVCGFALLGFALDQFALTPLLAQNKAAETQALVEDLSADDSLRIDIRTATREELMQLPGIGEKRAQDIIDHRNARQFDNVNEIMLIKGIGLKTYEKMKPLLLLFGAAEPLDKNATSTTPKSEQKSTASATSKTELTNIVNLNTAGTEELCTLPGIGEVKAVAIIAYREGNGPFRSVDELVNVKGIGAKTLAKIRHRLSI
jgi:competence protein ComEA